jgi:hypothetical protein
MLEPDAILFLLRPLNRLGAPYMVTGSVAATVYGEPRLTNDVDVVVELPAADAARFAAAFAGDSFYCPPVETIGDEARREARGHFNLIHQESGFKADVYLVGRDPLHRWALARRRLVRAGGEDVWIAPPEYVILRKLEYFREGGSEKHLRDVAAMLRVSGDALDRAALTDWIERLKLNEGWDRARGAGAGRPAEGGT